MTSRLPFDFTVCSEGGAKKFTAEPISWLDGYWFLNERETFEWATTRTSCFLSLVGSGASSIIVPKPVITDTCCLSVTDQTLIASSPMTWNGFCSQSELSFILGSRVISQISWITSRLSSQDESIALVSVRNQTEVTAILILFSLFVSGCIVIYLFTYSEMCLKLRWGSEGVCQRFPRGSAFFSESERYVRHFDVKGGQACGWGRP